MRWPAEGNVAHPARRPAATNVEDRMSARVAAPRHKYAIVEVPTDKLGRFLRLPSEDNRHYVIILDDIIRLHLSDLLPGYKVESCYSIKLTRDAELYIDDEFTCNLLLKIQKFLAKRKTVSPSRFLYDAKMP